MATDDHRIPACPTCGALLVSEDVNPAVRGPGGTGAQIRYGCPNGDYEGHTEPAVTGS
jgi:hypothetical protein